MDNDRIEGAATNFGGKVESAVGDMTNNNRLQSDGVLDQAKGTAQNIYGQVKDAVQAALEEASPRVREASQVAVGTVKQAPIVSALAVGAVGYLLAWALHGPSANRR